MVCLEDFVPMHMLNCVVIHEDGEQAPGFTSNELYTCLMLIRPWSCRNVRHMSIKSQGKSDIFPFEHLNKAVVLKTLPLLQIF